ncbi:SH3 domain-containing protein [Portibacter marinus]|uniref:SH3 domain-containing protein n=1 Tax=Portibacter marinus TaxID=2898660 RepID=UPI001F313A29|nr:SH3 domain-containing protein [Portibacter marinus]
MIRSIIFVFACMTTVLLGGQSLEDIDPKATFNQANRYFDGGNYEKAIEQYLRLNEEYASVALFHNMGLAYFYNDDLGKAILYMERAKRLAPLNKDVRKNLKLLNENVDSEVQNLPPFFLKAWANSVARFLNPGTWLVLHLLFLFGAVAFLYFYLLKGVDFNLHFYYIRGTIIGFMILSILSGLLAYHAQNLRYNTDNAVVLEDDTPLRAGADLNAQEIGQLNQGVKVRVEDQINDLLKVKLGDYSEGWVASVAIERI